MEIIELGALIIFLFLGGFPIGYMLLRLWAPNVQTKDLKLKIIFGLLIFLLMLAFTLGSFLFIGTEFLEKYFGLILLGLFVGFCFIGIIIRISFNRKDPIIVFKNNPTEDKQILNSNDLINKNRFYGNSFNKSGFEKNNIEKNDSKSILDYKKSFSDSMKNSSSSNNHSKFSFDKPLYSKSFGTKTTKTFEFNKNKNNEIMESKKINENKVSNQSSTEKNEDNQILKKSIWSSNHNYDVYDSPWKDVEPDSFELDSLDFNETKEKEVPKSSENFLKNKFGFGKSKSKDEFPHKPIVHETNSTKYSFSIDSGFGKKSNPYSITSDDAKIKSIILDNKNNKTSFDLKKNNQEIKKDNKPSSIASLINKQVETENKKSKAFLSDSEKEVYEQVKTLEELERMGELDSEFIGLNEHHKFDSIKNNKEIQDNNRIKINQIENNKIENNKIKNNQIENNKIENSKDSESSLDKIKADYEKKLIIEKLKKDLFRK